MKITTQSAIDISESLASFLFGAYLNTTHDRDPLMEKRMRHVDTAKYTIADLYLPSSNSAFEVKSIEHGTAALKGVIQSSIYLEQADKATLVMQKPRRRNLADGIESFCEWSGVGLIYIVSVPTICSEQTIQKATGGCAKPFELWKQNRYSTTRAAIINKSRSGWANEYIETIEEIVKERSDDIFEFTVKPTPCGEGFSELY